MAVGLSIQNLINITLNLTAVPLPVQNFQAALILGPSTVIDTVQRYRTYTTFTQVAQDFLSTTPEYAAAQAWFAQSPTPNILYIGRWVQAASSAQLVGGPLTATNSLIATWNAITTGGFKITINGSQYSIGPLNFSTDSNLNAVASRIQTCFKFSFSWYNLCLSGTL